MKRTLSSIALSAIALALAACGPSEEEIQEERAAEMRGSIVVSCLKSMNASNSPFEPAVQGELCNCAASEAVKGMGVIDENSSANVPPEAMSKIVKTCLAKVNPTAAGS
ncbi:MAG: hypothetical protein ABJP70_08680 [Erythrobacter sp.]